MNKKSKALILCLLLFVAFSLFAKHHKFTVTQDFYISNELSCDTESESCFVWDCDLADEECDKTPYKYIWKYAAYTPNCDPREEDCEELFCAEDEEDCEIIYCSEDTLGDEEYCYNN